MSIQSTAPPTANDLGAVLVDDVMHRGVVTCRRATSLATVAHMMAAHHVHCVAVVVDTPAGEPALWGIVSDSDVLATVVRGGALEATAATCAATEIVTATPEQSLGRAAESMDAHGVTHVVVVEPGTRRPIGVLSTLDIAEVVGQFSPPRQSAS